MTQSPPETQYLLDRAAIHDVLVRYFQGLDLGNDRATRGGQIEVLFATMTTAGLASQNAAGTVRVLAVSGDKRSTSLPSVPTAAEAGLDGYNALIWWGVSAPKGTPPEIIARLNAEVRSMLQKPAVRQKLQDMGGVPLGTSSAEAKEQIARETKELTAFVSTLGIKQ